VAVNPGSSAQACPRCARAAHPGLPCPAAQEPPGRPSGSDTQAAAGAETFEAPGGRGQGLTALGPGMHIGEYRVQERIGAGGMGVVYRAIQPRTGQSFAVKVLSTMHARDASSVQRFVLEIRAVNQIRHPNLVDIYSFGQLTDGRYYYVMEFLEGCSLGALMRARGQLRPADVLPVFLDVLRALEAAHLKGIVHRDLKPDNVFLMDGRPAAPYRAKLLDFGLAKLVELPPGMPPLTAAGMAVGTPQYMAPEQCRARKVDGRADLYALGVMLYEALTAKLPCDGASTLEIWEAHVRKVPRRPMELAAGMSAELDSIIMTLLAKTPEERFSSAATAAAALAGEIQRGQGGGVGGVVEVPFADGASLSDVARALPSSIQTADVIPLGGLPGAGGHDDRRTAMMPEKRSAEALRALLDPDLEIAEPALQTRNPNQVSALDIDLGVMRREQPAPPLHPASSGRAPRVAGVARTAPAPLALSVKVLLGVAALALVTAALFLVLR
jgi:serine/threonine protein kinase